MGNYLRKDRFYKKAKANGHASRAYYKIEQIQKRHRILRPGDHVVDLGCAPGGWLQFAERCVGEKGRVFGIDLLPVTVSLRKNVVVMQGDINDEGVIRTIKDSLGDVHVVISDMAPDTSGVRFRDSYLSFELANRAMEIARAVLVPRGHFVVKIFPGEEFAGYKKVLHTCFDKVVQCRPEATRKTSTEVYLIGMGFMPKQIGSAKKI